MFTVCTFLPKSHQFLLFHKAFLVLQDCIALPYFDWTEILSSNFVAPLVVSRNTQGCVSSAPPFYVYSTYMV